MKRTFQCNESIIITIPFGHLGDGSVDRLMPEKFSCVFRDSYKIFVLGGKPKPVGAAQALAGVFLSLIAVFIGPNFILFLPNLVYVITGLLTYAAGKGPQMVVAKLSFSLNIISLFWSIAAFSLYLFSVLDFPLLDSRREPVRRGVYGVALSLLLVQHGLCLFSIYWLSKAICRQQFNTLPIILLKRGD